MKYNKTDATPKTNKEVAIESLMEQEYLNEQQKLLSEQRLGIKNNKRYISINKIADILKVVINYFK